jgi:glycine betaine/proline transport system substrate-binding protein
MKEDGTVRTVRKAAIAGVALLALAGCTPADTTQSTSVPNGGKTPCGTVNVAINPWVGYEANAAVFTYLATNRLGCTVVPHQLTEQQSWEGFANGTIDVILENWGHADLRRKYIDQQKVAVQGGLTGNTGTIGWYVPPWLAKAHPDVLNWQNLNKYADKFRTAASGNQGQFLDGDPSYVTNDAALMRNLNLNFKVIFAGSENALIEAFRTAEAQKKWLIAYFYEPQWFLSELPLVHVKLPNYTFACAVDPAKIACDYQPYDLDKIMSTKFANSGSPAAALVRDFRWSNADQNAVARDLAANGMTAEAAAKKWIDAHQQQVDAWLAGARAATGP